MPSETDVIEDVLAGRYGTPEMRAIWSAEGKVIRERQLWLAVLRAQKAQGMNISDEALGAYEGALHHVNLGSIAQREASLGHDVKAKIEEFNALAGFQLIHLGLTSRDLTDNVEQAQIRDAMVLVRSRLLAVVCRLAESAAKHRDLAMCGRSHNVPAQPTTFGKRLATGGEEIMLAYNQLDWMIDAYPLRGLKGPMGTSQDQLDLLDGDTAELAVMEGDIADHLGFIGLLNSVGQVYPRSLDFMVACVLKMAGSGMSSLATTFRLMAGFNLFTEDRDKVGSSAMPHKLNANICERVCGLNKLLLAPVVALGQLAGDQWAEGDVSCSVVRRVSISQAFFCLDAMIESFLKVLRKYEVYPAMIKRELDEYLSYLASTQILMAATKKGMPREDGHAVIKRHAVAVAEETRRGMLERNDLLQRLGSDPELPLTLEEIEALLGDPLDSTGAAREQVDDFYIRATNLADTYPDAAAYTGRAVL